MRRTVRCLVAVAVVAYMGFGTQISNALSCADCGELLTLTFNSGGLTATMQLGGQSFTFDETQPGSTSTRQQATSLIASASSAFRDSLEQLTRDGFKYLTDFGVAAETLQTIFFYNSVTPTERVAAKVVQDHVSVFDSNTTQPSPFESQFGADYYQ